MGEALGFVVQPCCATHCRVWQETQGGKYPPSDHAPSCEHFKPQRYVALRADEDGPACICTPTEADAMQAEDDAPYISNDVMLTPDQYERLGEFNGF